ncbi:MAG: DUF4365 domain-containing protein [Desulfobaccales bacterium]
MPQRPRSHRLEDESWKFLSNLMPDYWVLRKPESDYGIDGQVEVFDSSGLSTGLIFLIQLKGTDIPDKKKSLSHRFPVDTIRYYRSIQLPVLLIRYVSASKEIYIRWAHEIAYGELGKKSLKVDFYEDRKWVELTPDILVEELKIFRRLRDPNLVLPLDLWLDLPGDQFLSIPIATVESLIKNASNNLSEIISFRKELSRSMVPKIKITNEIILVDFAGFTTFRISNPIKYYIDRQKAIQYLAHDILIMIAFLFHRLGYNNIAAEIAYEHFLSSSLLNDIGILSGIISCFALSKRMDLALNLSERVLDIFDSQSLYMIFALPVFKKPIMTEHEYNLFKKIMLKAIEKTKIKGYWKEAATCHYNLGNRIKGGRWGNYYEAFHHYRMASKYDPSYREREYFWREIGGILFLLKKFGYSEKCYSKALELGATFECKATRADALMFSGKYKEALDLFKEYSSDVGKLEPEWALKSWVLTGLMKQLRLESQTRNSEEAIRLADIKDLPREEANTRLNKALALDALCGLAWYNLGQYKSSKNDYAEASIAFLMAGIVQPNDIDAWINMIICLFNNSQYDFLLSSILSFAYRINGEDLIIRLSQIIEGQTVDNSSQHQPLLIELINLIGEHARKLGDVKEQKPILRIFSTDGTYRIIGEDAESSLEIKEKDPNKK